MLQQLLGKAKTAISGSIDKFQGLLDDMIEGVALFVVTTCVIPIVVMILLLVMINQVLGTNFSASSLMRVPLMAKAHIKERFDAYDTEE